MRRGSDRLLSCIGLWNIDFVEEQIMRGSAFATEAQRHSEGTIARTIEEQTARLPSDTFLWAALGSIGASLFLQTMGRRELSNFVGQWAPTFLILGLYNKLVKVAGSDRTE